MINNINVANIASTLTKQLKSKTLNLDNDYFNFALCRKKIDRWLTVSSKREKILEYSFITVLLMLSTSNNIQQYNSTMVDNSDFFDLVLQHLFCHVYTKCDKLLSANSYTSTIIPDIVQMYIPTIERVILLCNLKWNYVTTLCLVHTQFPTLGIYKNYMDYSNLKDQGYFVCQEIDKEIFKLDRIGKGGNGEVFRGIDIKEGKWIAIKITDPSTCENELETTKKLGEHDHLTPIFYSVKLDQFYCCVMPLAKCSLGRRMLKIHEQNPNTLPERVISELLNYILQITDGVNHIHSCGLVHRDINPNNVLIFDKGGNPFSNDETDEQLKVADYGTVKKFELYTTVTFTIGTVKYMAPEVFSELEEQPQSQLIDTDQDKSLDIYSLGVTIFQLFTNHDLKVKSKSKNLSVYFKDLLIQGEELELYSIIISSLTNKGVTSTATARLIISMIQPNPTKRPTCIDCIKVVTSIIKGEPLSTNLEESLLQLPSKSQIQQVMEMKKLKEENELLKKQMESKDEELRNLKKQLEELRNMN